MRVFSPAMKNIVFLLSLVGNYTAVIPILRLMKKRYPLFTSTTSSICIEGFPRSGNSFFVAAFSRWNPEVSIAHHTHLAASAKYAIRKQIPTVILVREPEEAIASAMAWDGKLNASIGLVSYINYYSSLLKYRDRFLVVPFVEATSSPEEVVSTINQFYGLSFRSVKLSDAELLGINNVLVKGDLASGRDGTNASLPNKLKSAGKIGYRHEIRKSQLFQKADALFKMYVGLGQKYQ